MFWIRFGLGLGYDYNNKLFAYKFIESNRFFLGDCYAKLNQLHEAKKYLRRSIELTKNELPYILLSRIYLLEDNVTEAQNAYTAALRYAIRYASHCHCF